MTSYAVNIPQLVRFARIYIVVSEFNDRNPVIIIHNHFCVRLLLLEMKNTLKKEVIMILKIYHVLFESVFRCIGTTNM
jgi:hypothetical protein